jgi:hypothetical protein
LNGTRWASIEFLFFDPDGVGELVDDHLVGIGGQRFLVAGQGLAFGHAIARKLHAQPEGHGVAGVGGGLVLDMDHVVRAGPHEFAEIGFLQCLGRELLGPQLVRE